MQLVFENSVFKLQDSLLIVNRKLEKLKFYRKYDKIIVTYQRGVSYESLLMATIYIFINIVFITNSKN